ncbi:hypothetical protein GQX74_004426 [Glossina fuscipes]|nr:hypothetical protein GQX74_004426 [Glossina fuscipes]
MGVASKISLFMIKTRIHDANNNRGSSRNGGNNSDNRIISNNVCTALNVVLELKRKKFLRIFKCKRTYIRFDAILPQDMCPRSRINGALIITNKVGSVTYRK